MGDNRDGCFPLTGNSALAAGCHGVIQAWPEGRVGLIKITGSHSLNVFQVSAGLGVRAGHEASRSL